MAQTDQQAKPLAPAGSALFQFRSDELEAASATINHHYNNPKINMNNVTLLQLELANGSLRNDTNVIFSVDVSIKNPNYASFKFGNGSSTVFYGGRKVGEAITPSGTAKARRTTHMNVTVNLVPEKMLEVPRLLEDVRLGQLSMNSSTVISGKVKIVNIVKKYYVVEVNCSVTYDFSTLEIQQHCSPHFL
ncbi:uncharacterized protein LOC126678699 [Mercurialis annua]|uniref:uncharacterized protein LOC126678699 n=1 Tax=Mercurialis annua TaxID=3986 RepID=UPI00215FC29E|nr:uncharacterized protein LOC126678699 [Mercurialis annua]